MLDSVLAVALMWSRRFARADDMITPASVTLRAHALPMLLALSLPLAGCGSPASSGSSPGTSSGGSSTTSGGTSGSSSGGGTGDYTAFVNEQPVTINGYIGDAMEPFLSRDSKYLFFNNSNDPAVNTDLFYALRIDGLNFQYQGPVQGANGDKLDAVASMDTSGNFYFISTRSYDTTISTLHSAPFASGAWDCIADFRCLAVDARQAQFRCRNQRRRDHVVV